MSTSKFLYHNAVLDRNGNAKAGAPVLVLDKITGRPINAYASSTATTPMDSVISGPDGQYKFWSNGGTYRIITDYSDFIAEVGETIINKLYTSFDQSRSSSSNLLDTYLINIPVIADNIYRIKLFAGVAASVTTAGIRLFLNISGGGGSADYSFGIDKYTIKGGAEGKQYWNDFNASSSFIVSPINPAELATAEMEVIFQPNIDNVVGMSWSASPGGLSVTLKKDSSLSVELVS